MTNTRNQSKVFGVGSAVVIAAVTLAACTGSGPSARKTSGAANSSSSQGPSDAQIRERSGPPVTFAPRGDKVLDKKKVILQSALGVDLTHNSVTMPLHKGEFNGKTVWYILTESSDFGLAHDLNVNFSPKLANMEIGCPVCVQDVTLTGASKNAFGEAVVHFQGAPDFSPNRKIVAGPASVGAFPPAKAQPGAVASRLYSPFIRLKGSSVVYNAPIIATGDGPFDLEHHTNTSDRVLSIKPPASPSVTPSGQSLPGSVEILLVQGREAGQKIFYLSTESSDPIAATIERATFIPALQHAPFLGGDDFLGAARERIFLFTNGQTGKGNPEAQGLNHVITDGHSTEDASLRNKPLIDALANQDGDTINVLGDFPSLADPRHANAYSPLWDAQIGEWTKKAISQKLNKRQDDENAILNLAAQHPDLLTGPLGAPYGAGDFVINCPTVAFTDKEPVIDQVAPVAHAQA